jgi:V/A-type H+-transporting ATPase subunit E
MGLDDVVQEVTAGAERQAKEILDAAQAEADALLEEARAQSAAYEADRLKQADRDVDQIKKQAISNAKFEARKAVLSTENDLRDDLRARIIDGLSALDAKTRKGHVATLLKTATGIIPAGKVFSAKQDESVLKSADDYSFGGVIDIAGGLVVESENGRERLDLSYETLLGDVWRDVLAAEAGLFE